MKFLSLHTMLCLMFLAGQLPQVAKADAAENSGNKLRQVTEKVSDAKIRKLSAARLATIRRSDLVSRTQLRRV